MATNARVGEQLDALEQELKCAICLSVFDDPHSLPCNHQFCNACIIESFRTKSQCPLCKLPTIKRAITRNLTLTNIINAYKAMRELVSTSSQSKPSPSPKKRSTPATIEPDSVSKRTRRSLNLADKTDSSPPPTPASPARKHSPASKTRDIGTQTTFTESKDGPFHLPHTPSRTTTTNTSTSPARTIDFNNITDWSSLKKTKTTTPTTPTTPSSPRHTSPHPNTKFTGTFNSKSNLTNTSPATSPKQNGVKPTSLSIPSASKLVNVSPHSSITSPSSLISPSTSPPNPHTKPGPFLESNAKAKTGNGVARPIAPKPKGKSKCKKVVVLTTSINPETMATIKTHMKDLGGTVVTKYTSDVTHIIAGLTGAYCARRTIKYCLGVMQGKWVVSAEWVMQSKAASYWIAEDTFEVEGDSVTQGGPKRAREAAEQGEEPLFSNCQIFLMGDFNSPTKAEFKRLLELGGAEVSAKTPTKKLPSRSKKTANSNTQIEAIICNPTSYSALARDEMARITGLGRPVVDSRWILDCVSNYKILPFTQYELSG